MSQDLQISQKVIDTYDQALRPIAEKLSFELPVQAREPAGFPSVLCLGNHSSGKSSFINHLLGEDIQKTGLAPTDDGFTIITHGSQRESLDGHTVTSHPALPWKNLERLGPAFLNRLKLKTIPNQLLTSFALIDSPGMIDAIGAANTREYDFAAGVRFFAEKADLILFFFDPDKPGTTAETIGILTQTLAGLEYKLLIILNKVDLFQNIRDFARTYGTLSWNLSKAIRTKDIPHIYNIYLPEQRTQETLHGSLGIPLNDFDQSREEVIQEIHRTPTRRADNLVSDLLQATKKLILHAKLCSTVKLEYRKLQFKWGFISLSILLAGVLATWGATQTWPGWEVTAGVGTAGLLATIAARIEAGQGIDALSLAVAAWIRWQVGHDDLGNLHVVDDPLAVPIAAMLGAAATTQDRVAAILAFDAVVPPALGANPLFRDILVRWLTILETYGARAALETFRPN